MRVAEPLEIKNQARGDECVASAIASIAEDRTSIILDPLPLYQKASDGGFGEIPSKVAQTAIDFGLQPKSGGPKLMVFKDYHRLWCWNYFYGIQKVLENRKVSVLSGCFWQPEWDKEEDGIIESFYQNLTIFPHAFKVFGFEEKNGIIYLVVQNSRGENVGDKGIFYFPEQIAKKFHFAYYFDYQ